MDKEQLKIFWKNPLFTRFYYGVKPLIPRRLQIYVRRFFISRNLPSLIESWPIDPGSGKPPEDWQGWPDGKRFALVLTHDVESEKGVERCRQLARLEMDLGFRSSFNFLLMKYSTPDSLRSYLEENGFEVGIHGCYHDGKKFSSREIFLKRAAIINRKLKDWDACGFRAPSMHSNLDWIGDLNIEYDLSTFDTDPFEPLSSSVKTIFPFIVSRRNGKGHFVELPYTLPQDSTLFILLRERNIDIWKRKLDWIVKKGGMALINVHPDYIHFNQKTCEFDEYPVEYYRDFLDHIRREYEGQFYHALPRDVARFIAGRGTQTELI